MEVKAPFSKQRIREWNKFGTIGIIPGIGPRHTTQINLINVTPYLVI